MSNTSTTPPVASTGIQQELMGNADATTFTSPNTHSRGFVSNIPGGSYSSPAFVSPKSCATWKPYYQHDLHQTIHRRGSLPLKKRRVAMLEEDHPHPFSLHRVDGSGFRTIDSLFECATVEHSDDKPTARQQSSCGYYHLDHELLKRNHMNTSPFDKMNTLTLIAAAAAVNEAGRSSEYTFQPNTVSFTSSLSSFDRVDQMRYPNTTFTTSGHDESSVDDSSASEPANSRSADDADNSRCTHSQELNTSATTASQNDHSTAESRQKTFKTSIAEKSSQEYPSGCSSGQDKRYTGLSPSQMRCNATTTRGRPCTYTAVQSTKYCFLHADYATNPPPRRIKSSNDDDREISASSSLSQGMLINTEDYVSDDEDHNSESPAPSVESNAYMKSKLQESTVAVFKKRRTNAKFAEKHAESHRPLLSMMATDQWFGQSVEIAVGPFEGRTGIVQKWGNGWITVLIDGVGFHNRRSFELYIDTSNEQKLTELNSKLGKKKKSWSDSNIKDQSRLFRCVSRDAVSPSPTATNSANFKSSAYNGGAKKSRAVTPKPSSIVNSRTKKDGPTPNKDGVNSASSIEIPETPLPQCVSDGAETPVSIKSSLEGITHATTTISLPTPKVTPFSEKTTTGTRMLTAQDRCNVDLRFPGHSDDETKQSTGIKSSDSALVFRPSMGERTRGRSSNLAGSHNSGESIDSGD